MRRAADCGADEVRGRRHDGGCFTKDSVGKSYAPLARFNRERRHEDSEPMPFANVSHADTNALTFATAQGREIRHALPVVKQASPSSGAPAVKRLALLALLLASSSVVAAAAPLAKPQRKADRPAAAQQSGASVIHSADDVVLVNFAFGGQAVGAIQPNPPPPRQAPAQPPNADPPG
jgi:hypothetical protein